MRRKGWGQRFVGNTAVDSQPGTREEGSSNLYTELRHFCITKVLMFITVHSTMN
jgi:hypothetical protein